MKKYLITFFLFVGFMFFASLATAQPAQTTLEKIKQNKEIIIGHRLRTIPLSFVGNDGQPHGYALDISLQVAEYLKTLLNMPDLKVTYHPMTVQDRINLVRSGAIDLECSSTTITPERAKLVGFSLPFYVSALTFMFDQTKIPEISSLADLTGHTVALIKTTTAAIFLQNINEEQQLGINLIVAEDDMAALRLLESGQAVALFHDDVLLAGLRTHSSLMAKFVIAGKAERLEPYGCMYKLGDDEFGHIVNTALVNYAKSDGLTESYKKWFVYPIDTLDGINLKLPMSRATRGARDALKQE